MRRSRLLAAAAAARVMLRAALLVGLLAGSAAGQTADRLETEFSGATLAALQAELRAAESAGLPSRPLVLKALEGRSKGASDARIVDAVAGLRLRLERAAAALGTRDEDVLLAAAAALYVGVDDSMLQKLTASTRTDALGMAFVVVGDLVRRGVPVREASQAVTSLASAGARAESLDAFRRQVNADIATGLAPSRATEVRMRGLLMTLDRPGPNP
ncbi:MAG: hypothetical protein P8099_01455 [Gemmatimonadota bacterium]|jgi:hypothetical protein